jgi:hypothetical protein
MQPWLLLLFLLCSVSAVSCCLHAPALHMRLLCSIQDRVACLAAAWLPGVLQRAAVLALHSRQLHSDFPVAGPGLRSWLCLMTCRGWAALAGHSILLHLLRLLLPLRHKDVQQGW